jgi:hypothetical protein
MQKWTIFKTSHVQSCTRFLWNDYRIGEHRLVSVIASHQQTLATFRSGCP